MSDSNPPHVQESSPDESFDVKERAEKVYTFAKDKVFKKLAKLPTSFWLALLVLAIATWGFFIRIANVARLSLNWTFPFIHLEKVTGLIDHTTGKLIPLALDPFVILRYVKEIVTNGAIPVQDAMRYYPVGFNPQAEFSVLSNFIAYLYKFLAIFFPNIQVETVHVIYPAIAFFIGIIFFFLVVKRLFSTKTAIIASMMLTVVPSFLYRTVSGFSDKEAFSMMMLFIGMYFFIAAWQSKYKWNALFLGILSGIITGINGLVWGGVGFVYFIFGIFTIILILIDKFSISDLYAYIGWFIPTVYIATMTSLSRTSIGDMAVSVTSGAMFFALVLGLVDYFVFKKDYFNVKSKFEKKMPLGLANILVSTILLIVGTSIVFGISFIPGKISNIMHSLIYPLGDRWALTVAESHEPFISDWFGQMGTTYVMLLFTASVVLFYDIFRSLKKYRIAATAIYSALLFMFIFSRFSSGHSILNGTSPLAKILFIGPLIAFFGLAIIFYIWSFMKNKGLFQAIGQINKNHIFVFIWFIIMIMAARRAIRLIFVFSSISAVLVAYVLVRAFEASDNLKRYNYMQKAGFYSLMSLITLFAFDRLLTFLKIQPGFYFDGHRNLVIILALLASFCLAAWIKIKEEKDITIFNYVLKGIVVLLTVLLLMNMTSQTYGTAKVLGPSYHQQWQTAGGYVRENIDQDAVFSHWWDYGYWVQTGFERASITDGGNAMGSWNHYMGRYLLTSPNDDETLEFLNTHEATHILFVADEIGKYPAYSSIGADATYDRYSWINVFQLDPAQTQETRNQTILVYTGGTNLDDDFVYQDTVFPANGAGIAGFSLPITNTPDGLQSVERPTALLVKDGQPTPVPLNCVFIGDRKIEWDDPNGLDGCLRVIPNIGSQNGVGAALYLSPDVADSLFARLYLMNEHETNENYDLVYSDHEQVPLALYPSGLHGPIRIWEINYPEGTPVKEEYLSTAYIDPTVTQI